MSGRTKNWGQIFTERVENSFVVFPYECIDNWTFHRFTEMVENKTNWSHLYETREFFIGPNFLFLKSRIFLPPIWPNYLEKSWQTLVGRSASRRRVLFAPSRE